MNETRPIPNQNKESKEKRSPWKKAFIALSIVSLLCIATLAFIFWWNTRPIKATQLSQQEQTALDHKISLIHGDNTAHPTNANLPHEDTRPAETSPIYEKGGKTLILTERELNGLLNNNTEYGETIKFQLATDSIYLKVSTIIPEDFPVGAGKPLKGRARIFAKIDENKQPTLVIDDLTIWGVSLPNDWLGGVKGQNIFELIGGDLTNNPIAAGIKDIKITPGQLLIEFNE